MLSTVKRALVVGGTGGIGYAMALRIASEAPSALVIISGRTKPENIPHSNIEFRALDASSMRAIKKYADAYKSSPGAQDQKIDLLVLTQGILSMAGRSPTPGEGIDRKMALHYYGRQLLIRELLPVLSEDAKVVTVLDSLRGSSSKLIWDDLDLKTHFSLGNAANHCLSMTDAMVQEYAAEPGNSKRHFVHAFPGFVNTGLSKGLPWYVKLPLGLVVPLVATSPEDCAKFMLDGIYEGAAAGEKSGVGWSYVDQKGRLVNDKKEVWKEEQRKTVKDHTWKIVDDAIAVSE
jgi:NAD(P)-dependent dehydrogenase (short-subunit alcohol dehydrogenase family)